MNILLGGSACVCFRTSVFDIWPAVVLIPFPSPQIRRHSQHIRNSAQLSWDHWNHRRGFLTKFGRAAQRTASTCSLVERGERVYNKDRVYRETSEQSIDWKERKTSEKNQKKNKTKTLQDSYVGTKPTDCGGLLQCFCRFSLVVFFDCSWLGNVYIPPHDLFTDIPASCKHCWCSR